MTRNLFLTLATGAFLFSSCSKDTILDATEAGKFPEYSGEKVYLSAKIQLPTTGVGMRSSTVDPQKPDSGYTESTDGTEMGWDYENNVNTCCLVLALESEGKYRYLAHALTSGIRTEPAEGTGGSNARFSVTGEFSKDEVTSFYEKYGEQLQSTDYQVYLFAYCNYSNEVVELFSDLRQKSRSGENPEDPAFTDWKDFRGKVEESPSLAGEKVTIENSIWVKNAFLMSNAEYKKAKLPNKAEVWDNYTDADHPFDLCGTNADDGQDPGEYPANGGAIMVERAAARIDFRDASADNPQYGIGSNTYKVLAGVTESGEGEALNLVNVKLTRMSMVNMNKHYYLLRRVSDDGYNENSHIGWPETPVNYVVDAKWEDVPTTYVEVRNAIDGKTFESGNYYNFPLFAKYDETMAKYPYARTSWYVDNIDEVTAGEHDADERGEGTYKIWRYVTENTIPKDANATDKENRAQITGLTSGIVFKGKIFPGEDFSEIFAEDIPYLSEGVQKALAASELGVVPGQENGYIDENGRNLLATDKYKGKYTEEDFKNYSYPALYLFEGRLYAGFNEVVEAAYADGQGGTLYTTVERILSHYYCDGKTTVDKGEGRESVLAFKYHEPGEVQEGWEPLTVTIFNQILGNIKKEDWVEETMGKYHAGTEYGVELAVAGDAQSEARFKKLVTQTGTRFNFTLYDATDEHDAFGNGGGWGYYCYYFYWNRHNDNVNPGIMHPMEFAVVRNNVYKLAVTQIERLGHPVEPSNDPDPQDPGDPDEDPTVYMKISVEVLPWVVRKNDIQF